jgi:hypothetical protein
VNEVEIKYGRHGTAEGTGAAGRKTTPAAASNEYHGKNDYEKYKKPLSE